MGPLKSMTTSDLKQIVNNTALDYDIRIQADTEVLRREINENGWRTGTEHLKRCNLHRM